MSTFRCIYCGKSIPGGVGLRCAGCNNEKAGQKEYDKEFRYADEIEPHVAETMRRLEEESFITSSSNQTREEFRRQFEKNVAARKQHQFPMQDELQVNREGRILHMNEFITRLRSTGLYAWYSDKGGMARTLGLYVSHNDKQKYIGFVQVPFMQEYEELHFDRYNVPLGSKRRGWRTVLLKLIENGVLTEQQAHEAFGEPQTGPVSRRYREYLQFIRSTPRS